MPLGLKRCMGTALIALVSCGPAQKPESEGSDKSRCRMTEAPKPIPLGEALMQPICDGVYAEPGLTAAEHGELQRDYEAARRDIVRAFGPELRSSPLTFFCRTASCKVAFGAPPDVAASNDLGFTRDGVQAGRVFVERTTVTVTAPVAATARILTHEYVHAEMKAWVPYESLPTWFNEGVATMIANEPNCDAYPPSSLFDVRRLNSKQEWQDYIRSPGATLEAYCQARHEVSAWAASFGDEKGLATALRRLMSAVARGVDFEHAYVR